MPARFGDCGWAQCRRARFYRKFGRPRQLDSWERVWLIGEGVEGAAEFWINGHSVGRQENGAFAFPVTEAIDQRNELIAEVAVQNPTGGLWGEICLEVRCSAYLQDVRAAIDDGRIVIRGSVAGTADQALELYALCNNHSIGYGRAEAGTLFELRTDPVDGKLPNTIRIDLVNRSVIWYSLEVPVTPPS